MAQTHSRQSTVFAKKKLKSSACLPSVDCGWTFLFVFSISFLMANGRGGVHGFVPEGIAFGPSGNTCTKLATSLGAPHPTIRSCDHPFGKHRHRRRQPNQRTFPSPSPTQLGITVVLPMPITVSPRLTGTLLTMAESWAPAVGVFTSLLLYLSPATAVWSAIRRARNQIEAKDDPMDGLSPLPIALLPSVAVSWLAYGLASSDPYIIMGNLPGTLLSIAYLIAILPLMNYNAAEFPTLPNLGNDGKTSTEKDNETGDAPKKQQRTKPKKSKTLILTQSTVLLSTASSMGLWGLLGLMTAGATDGMYNIGGFEFGMGFSSMLRSGVIVQSLGVYAASLFILLSASPLFMIRHIIKTKSSRSILGSLTAACCVNTGLWTAYGLAVNDHFVWGPNIIALSLGLMQLALKIIYPSNGRRTKTEKPLELSPTTN